jgi:hypothetical protein
MIHSVTKKHDKIPDQKKGKEGEPFTKVVLSGVMKPTSIPKALGLWGSVSPARRRLRTAASSDSPRTKFPRYPPDIQLLCGPYHSRAPTPHHSVDNTSTLQAGA